MLEERPRELAGSARREADFTSRLRSPAVAARVGLWLGICFGICFVTGLVSHYAQDPDHPIPFPTSPSWGYRVTQGLHVVTGTACVPLLLVKLWSGLPAAVHPAARRGRGRSRVDGLERASIGVLVAAAIFQLATGLANSAQWYPWTLLLPAPPTTPWPGWRSGPWWCTSPSSCRSSAAR